MKQKKLLKIALTLFLAMTAINSFGQIYNADFSNDGDGFADHTTAIPPATGPTSVGPFGNTGNQWSLSYTTTPGSDTSANTFKVVGGKLETADWGGEAKFQSQAIDISSISTIDISASGLTLGDAVQNVGAEFFNYFYILDGGTPVEFDIALSGDTAGTAVNYSVTNLDVSSASSLVVGFAFNCDGAGDGYSISSFIVTSVGGPATPGITLSAVSGNTIESGTTATFTVVLTAQPTDDIVLNISSADIGEVTVSPSTLTFTNANWETPQQITLTGVDDMLFDGNQDVIITVSVDDALSDDAYDLVADVATTVTNEDDDFPPSIGFGSATSTENETDITFTSANIPITVANYSGTQIDINVSVTGGSAEVGDYTFTSPTALSFTGNGTQNITVDINDDADTDNETIIFTITETSSVTGLVISQTTHTLTILDDEAPAAYAGVGTFVKITDVSEIVDSGYYVLLDETEELFAMSNVHNGTFLAPTSVTPSSNTLTDPATSIVWEIKTNGGGKSIYNAASTKYISYTGSSNNIQIVDDVTTDNQRWTIAFVTDEFQISNLALTTRRLQYNSGSPRFVCYTGSQRDISIYKLVTTTTWTGNVDSDWATAGNWSDGVPTISKSAIIPDVTNAPIIGASTNAIVFNLSVSEPDGLVINSGGTLIVNGTSSGNVTYNRNLGTTNWYLVSSPVAGETYDDAYITANGLAINGSNNAIATYTSADNTWAYMQTGGGASFNAGVGYSVRKQTSAGDISFTGTINTADVSVGVSNAGTGFNLLGNPYSAYINSATFLTDNTANLDSETIWVWNQATNNYETKVTGDGFVLAPTQGFFVRANAATSLNIAESYQSTTGNAFQKSAKTEVVLNMTDGANNRFAKIYYLDNATTGFDNGYDGETFGGIANTTDVFTHLVANSVGKKFQVQSLPNTDHENMVVPIGVIATSGKEITFTAEAMNLPEGIKVFLEDKVTNTMTRLDEANATYKVTLTEALNGIGRFYLHTKSSGVLGTDTIALNNVSIYSIDASTLRVAGLSEGKANVKIYSILGKQVFETSFNATGVKDMQLPKLASGIYVVQLATEKGTLNKKITLE